MRFTLANSSKDSIELNLTVGSVIKAGEEINIRAKTLLVLKYLIKHTDQIVTKQALLEEIWHDVVVQEQVLVQSIKEIRNLLGSDVIKTYSRQGYQWVGELTAIASKSNVLNTEQPPIHRIKLFIKHNFYGLSFSFLALLALIFTLFIINHNNQTKPLFTVAFLPVENAMPDDIHDWVPLAGMDYLSKRLQQQSQLQLFDQQVLLDLLNTMKNKTNISLPNNSQQYVVIREAINADLLVSTRLLGYPQDFQLHYTLYLPHSTERGIEFADSVEKTFEQLIEKIAQRFGQFTPKNSLSYQSDFSNEAFARGIDFYLHRDYKQAIAFFDSALTSNNDLLVARRYLAASYINNDDIAQGVALMKENIKYAQLESDHREEIRSNLMIGVLLLNWQDINEQVHQHLTEAEQYIQRSKLLAEQYQDSLFSAYANEELAKIKRLQGHYEQAILLLNTALAYHQAFRGNYGQTNALIELARIASAQHHNQLATDYFHQATVVANKNGVATNKVAILLAQAEIQQHNGKHKLASNSAQQAKTIAEQSNNNVLKAKVAAWLEHNSLYEIN